MGLLENALVVLFDGKRAYHGYTDSSGQITFSNVVAGTYQVVIVKNGYKHYLGTITVDEDKTVDITLSPIPVYKPYEEITIELPSISYESNVFSGEEQTLNLLSYIYEYEVS